MKTFWVLIGRDLEPVECCAYCGRGVSGAMYGMQSVRGYCAAQRFKHSPEGAMSDFEMLAGLMSNGNNMNNALKDAESVYKAAERLLDLRGGK